MPRKSLLVVAVASALILSACGSSSTTTASSSTPSGGASSGSSAADAAQGKQVTFVGPIAVPVWLQARDGFKNEANKLGMKPTWFAPSTVDIPTIVQSLQDALNSGADGLVTCALDPKAFTPVLQQAKQKNVPVILTDCDIPDKSQRTAFVGTIGKTFGKASGQKLDELTDGKGKAIVMQGQFDAQIQNDIFAGFKDGIADSSIQIVAHEADNSDVQAAVTKFEQLFRTYPDADIVYCIEAGCAGAAATVAKETNRKVTIFGTDDNKETLDGIRSGAITISAAQPFTKMGQLAAQYLADSFNGKQVPSITDTGVIFIQKDNVDTYLTQ